LPFLHLCQKTDNKKTDLIALQSGLNFYSLRKNIEAVIPGGAALATGQNCSGPSAATKSCCPFKTEKPGGKINFLPKTRFCWHQALGGETQTLSANLRHTGKPFGKGRKVDTHAFSVFGPQSCAL
jgi:hypothetical protein